MMVTALVCRSVSQGNFFKWPSSRGRIDLSVYRQNELPTLWDNGVWMAKYVKIFTVK